MEYHQVLRGVQANASRASTSARPWSKKSSSSSSSSSSKALFGSVTQSQSQSQFALHETTKARRRSPTRQRPLPSKITEASSKFTVTAVTEVGQTEPPSGACSSICSSNNISEDGHGGLSLLSSPSRRLWKESDGNKSISQSNNIVDDNETRAKNSDVSTMQDSEDCVHVWVRHSIIASVLAIPNKPSYGQLNGTSAPNESRSPSGNGHQRHAWTPTRSRTGSTTSLSGNVSISGSQNSRSPQRKALHTYGQSHSRRQVRGSNTTFSSDDVSVNSQLSLSTSQSQASNTNGQTTPARWGWVKASLIQNEVIESKRIPSSQRSPISPESKSAHMSTTWKRKLKTTIGTAGSNISPSSSKRTKPPSPEFSPLPQPTSVTLEIIDLESEYYGKVVNIPMDALPDSHTSERKLNGQKQHSNLNVSNGNIYGDGIVMANSWPNFTSIPKTNTSKSTQQNSSTTFKTPNKFKWSSSRSIPQSFSTQQQEPSPDNSVDNSDDLHNTIPSDLTNLTHLHEPAVVYCLRNRYVLDEIYTSTGPILLALNPFKDIRGVYGEDLMKTYWEKGEGILNGVGVISSNERTRSNRRIGDGEVLPPHVYAVADNAFRNMIRVMEDRSVGSQEEAMSDQSILVSGESGAGKTVTTKIIMKYLAALSKRSSGSSLSSTNTKIMAQAVENSKSISRGGGMWGRNVGQKRSSNIEQQVLESNPILESFGNARTIRNDNSSRFGKFIEIRFTSYGKLIGASVDSYLLEKVRLINQADGERNYHIFYELLAGSTRSQRKSLLLGEKSAQDFRMTSSASQTYKRRDGVKDEITFGVLRKAMGTMGFNEKEQFNILQIVSSLLHLSNLTFKENASNGCSLDDANVSLNSALHLLGVSRDSLDHSLCCVNIEAGGEKVVKKLLLPQSIKAKEALIKATYGALFAYLVKRINTCVNSETEADNPFDYGNDTSKDVLQEESPEDSGTTNSELKSDAFIGVLDIFGFESFEENSFEQLCINYCNESLQQQFNKFVFKLEQAEYEREGISWNFIAFPDNQDVLDLIDKKRAGILSILDEQSFLGQCTDQSFAQSMYQNCCSGSSSQRNNPNNTFSASTRQMANGTFSIKHYAGPVEYNINGFLEKNKDELPKETLELLLSSENKLLKYLATIMNTAPSTADDSVNVDSSFYRSTKVYKQNSLKRMSVGMQFSSQLALLRKRIDTTSPHYIRCLKPNDELQPDNFDAAVIAEQLRCGGILEAVRVSRVGYPQRYPQDRFVLRYQALAMKELNFRRKDASTSYTTPVGFGGFHGEYIPKNQRSLGMKKQISNGVGSSDSKLTAEKECKILVSVLARLLSEARQETNISDLDEEENIAPDQWSDVKKQHTWPTPPSNYRSPMRSKKKQELSLIEIGIQMGKTKVFLRQHAFEALERMRGRIKAVAATVINSIIRMFLRRRRYIIMRNEYRTRLMERSRMIQNANQKLSHCNRADVYIDENSAPPELDARLHFHDMNISLHREPDYEGIKEFMWVWVDNRWVKNDSEEASEV